MGETLSTCVSDGADNAQPTAVKPELEQVRSRCMCACVCVCQCQWKWNLLMISIFLT
jgi:hypothetical protein